MDMHDRSPVWLLDVDGVINATRPGWAGAPHQGLVHDGRAAWRFRWDPNVTAFIREVALNRQAQIRWATTWVPWRASLEATFRLPAFPVAFTLDGSEDWRSVDEVKTAAALHVVETERRPLVWTDDDVVPQHGALRERLEAAGVPVLLIAPTSNRGLRPADVGAIRSFLTAVR